ncbi:MAG TPA: universal stress protein [Armatimonadota bacterium]|nr:universal stress protein [Armatimonadota bacterium]
MQVVYATDGSPGSAAAGAFLRRMPLTPEDVILLLAVDAPGPADGGGPVFDAALQALDGSLARIESRRLPGQPAEQTVECAREVSADLIALGPMGSSGLARYLAVNVAERVLRDATTSVLVARPVAHGMRRALVALDTSRVSEAVMRAAAWLPLPLETELRLVTVLPPTESLTAGSPMIWAAATGDLDEIKEGSLKEAEARLRELGRMVQHTRRAVAAEVLWGDPASTLVAAAKREEADLIVLGARGEGGVDDFLLGSVSEHLARNASCSVMVVR